MSLFVSFVLLLYLNPKYINKHNLTLTFYIFILRTNEFLRVTIIGLKSWCVVIWAYLLEESRGVK